MSSVELVVTQLLDKAYLDLLAIPCNSPDAALVLEQLATNTSIFQALTALSFLSICRRS
jgi:hypothetical protein